MLEGNPQSQQAAAAAAAAAALGSPRPMDDIYAAKTANAGGAATAATAAASRLNPSVYSHPNAQDPVLSAKNYFPVLGGKKANVDITSSGAFFDPKAVSRSRLTSENRCVLVAPLLCSPLFFL